MPVDPHKAADQNTLQLIQFKSLIMIKLKPSSPTLADFSSKALTDYTLPYNALMLPLTL